MDLNAFIQAVPSGVRLLIALAITLTITLVAARLMRGRRERILAVPEGKTPAEEMLNVALGVVLTAFVFLAAILIANFWGSLSVARSSVSNEQTAISQIAATLALIGEKDGDMSKALKDYAAAAREIEGPALRNGDGATATASHNAVSQPVVAALASIKGKGTTVDEATITTGVKDLLTNGSLRMTALPTAHSTQIFIILGLIGMLGLALAVILVPESRPATLIVLVTLSFALTFLYFIVVEMANPYVSGDIVPLPGI